MSRCPKCGAIDVSEQAHQTRYGCGTVTTPENGVVLVGHACLERQLVASEARAKRLQEAAERASRVLGCPSSMAAPPEEVSVAKSILDEALAAKESGA